MMFLSLRLGPAPRWALQRPPREAEQPGDARRHDVDDEDENGAVNGARDALRDGLGDVGHEQHEGAAEQRSGKPADPADDEPDEQPNRQRESEAVGGYELHHGRAKRSGDAGVHGADAESERLVEARV